MTLKPYILLFVMMVTVALSSAVSWAQSVVIDLDKINPLKVLELLPDEEFKEQTQLYIDTPYDDNFLSFEVRLPKEWQESTLPNVVIFENEGGLSKKVLGVVARYTSPPINHQRSFFTVEAIEITHEIGARDWFIYYVMKSGLSIEQVGLESDKQVEALYVEIIDDVTYIVRVMVVVNGPRMVVARYYLPQDNFSAERSMQAQVIKSFELTNRQEVPVEKLELYGFLDQSFFDYPVSWAVSAPKIRSIDRMRAMLYHGTDQTELAGQINIYLTNKVLETSKSKELKYYKDRFTIENYKIDKFIGDVEMEYNKDMTFGRTQSYAMKATVSDLIDYELWVSVLENDQYYYIVTLLTPAREEDFYTWARNKEAYALLLKGIRLKDENVDYYRFLK